MFRIFASFLKDFRYAFRGLLGTPGFTVAVVLTLALGIGANTAMFSLIDAYCLKPLPGITEPDRLVNVRSTQSGRVEGWMTYLDFADLRARNQVFSGLMAYNATVLDMGQGNDTLRVQAALVSSNYFAVLGVRASPGRTFLPEEERPAGAHPVAAISHRLWQRAFQADIGLPGKTVVLNGRSYTVVGVAAPGFRGHTTEQAFDVWLPLAMYREANPGILGSVNDRTFRWLSVVGRLAPGASIPQAQVEMSVLAHQLEQSGSGNSAGFGVSLNSVRPSLVHDTDALILIASVAVLFLIVCANLSILSLALRMRNASGAFNPHNWHLTIHDPIFLTSDQHAIALRGSNRCIRADCGKQCLRQPIECGTVPAKRTDSDTDVAFPYSTRAAALWRFEIDTEWTSAGYYRQMVRPICSCLNS